MGNSGLKHKICGKRVQIVRSELDGRTILRPSGGAYPQKLNQDDFAEIIGWKKSTLQKIECGDRRLTEERAEEISEIAQIPAPVEWLMGETDIRNAFDAYVARIDEADQEMLSFNSAVMIFYDAAEAMQMNVQVKKPESLKQVVSNEKWDRMSVTVKLSLSDYEVRDNQKSMLSLSNDEMQTFQKRLTRYAKLLIEEMIEEGEIDDGEH